MEKTRLMLLEHYHKYPKLQIQDLFKFIYQSSFGCEHLVSSLEKATLYIAKEYENIVSLSDIISLNNNQKEKRNITYDIVKDEVTAPVKKGDIVGKINVYEDGNFKYSVNLTVMKNVDKANIFTVFIRNLKDVVSINL
jgi:D-alanyl-D-alanine carboxypeptidase